MSAELIGILTAATALAALIVTVGWHLRSALRSQDLRAEKRADELRADLRALDARVGHVEQGQARIAGLLEGAGLFQRVSVPASPPGEAATGD